MTKKKTLVKPKVKTRAKVAKRGRKKLAINLAKTRLVNFKVTREQYKTLKARARKDKVCHGVISAYVRKVALGTAQLPIRAQ